MDFNPISDVKLYASVTFTPEFQDEINTLIDLMEAFEYKSGHQKLYDVLHGTETDDLEITQQNFRNQLHEIADFLLEEHQIRLHDEATLEEKNQLLVGLFRLQSVEDPVPLILMLENRLSGDLEKFSQVMETVTTLSQEQVLTVVAEVHPSTLVSMQEYLETLEAEQETNKNLPEHLQPGSDYLENLQAFLSYQDNNTLATVMIRNGAMMGATLDHYLPYVGKHVVASSEEQTALNVLSLLMLSEDTYRDPVQSYRKISDSFDFTSQQALRVEVLIMDILSKFRQYRKAQDDAKRLSVV